MGPVLGIPLLAVQQVTGRQLSWGWFTALIMAALAWQYFAAYNNERSANEAEAPKLFLRYVEGRGPATSGLCVQTEGERQAFSVRISSEDVVGKDHMRLGLAWSAVPAPVGNDPVQVAVVCESHRGNLTEGYGGEQILRFFDRRASESEEFIATVDYTNVDGRPYQRKFRIYRHRDAVGNVHVHCDPLAPKVKERGNRPNRPASA